MKELLNEYGVRLELAGMTKFTAPAVESSEKFGGNVAIENCYVVSLRHKDFGTYNFVSMLAQSKRDERGNKYYIIAGFEGRFYEV